MMMTVRMLQDLNMMTMGKLTRMMAILLVREAVNTMAAQIILLRVGIGVGEGLGLRNSKL